MSKNPLKQEFVGAPMLRMGMDLAGPYPTSNSGNKYILVIQDYWSRWVEVFAIPDKRAETVAAVLVEEIFTRYGTPWRLHSDQGMEFEASLIHELCKSWDIFKQRTTPFAPWSNGMVERSNRSIKQMLRQAVLGRYSGDWDKKLCLVRMAYNNTEHATTGHTPHELWFSRCEKARLPVDLLCGTPPRVTYVGCEHEYVVKQREWCQEICYDAYRENKKQCSFQKAGHARGGLRIRKYTKGMQVLRLVPPNERNKTGKTIWQGPLKVIEVDDTSHLVRLKVPASGPGGRMRKKWVNTSNVKPYLETKRTTKDKPHAMHVDPDKDWLGRNDDSDMTQPNSKQGSRVKA